MASTKRRYVFSVVELTGRGWNQGELLCEGEGSAEEIAAAIAGTLDQLIERCDTGGEHDGDRYEPALEINVTRKTPARST